MEEHGQEATPEQLETIAQLITYSDTISLVRLHYAIECELIKRHVAGEYKVVNSAEVQFPPNCNECGNPKHVVGKLLMCERCDNHKQKNA